MVEEEHKQKMSNLKLKEEVLVLQRDHLRQEMTFKNNFEHKDKSKSIAKDCESPAP